MKSETNRKVSLMAGEGFIQDPVFASFAQIKAL